MSAVHTLTLVPAQAQPKHSLVEYLDDITTIQTTLDSLDDETLDAGAREDLDRMMITALAGTRAKIDRTAGILATFESAALASKVEAERQTARAKYFARQSARIEAYVLATLAASNLKKLDGTVSTLSARNNPPSVVIDDESAIPTEYLRWPPEPPPPPPVPDKALLKKALAAGPVDGCRLMQTVRLVRS